MASIDLKDAFFSVPIHSTHQKYLQFRFDDLFQFTCMPNGYGAAMRVFPEISKVSLGHLRSLGHNSVVYVDDSYLQGDKYLACLYNISDTIKLLRELGFLIHTEKSVLTPSQTIVFLDFIISSCGFQQYIYQEEQSILRQISNLEYWRMLLSGNSILLFFIKFLKNLENQIYISLLLELISN